MFAAEKYGFKIERFLNELHTHWNKIKFTPMQYLTRKNSLLFSVDFNKTTSDLSYFWHI